MELICIEELVPPDHLLRKIVRIIEVEFIRDKVKDLYCADNGRPAADPGVLFKILFRRYLFAVRSERTDDGKELYGHRYMRMGGLLRAQEPCRLSAISQTMKKM